MRVLNINDYMTITYIDTEYIEGDYPALNQIRATYECTFDYSQLENDEMLSIGNNYFYFVLGSWYQIKEIGKMWLNYKSITEFNLNDFFYFEIDKSGFYNGSNRCYIRGYKQFSGVNWSMEGLDYFDFVNDTDNKQIRFSFYYYIFSFRYCNNSQEAFIPIIFNSPLTQTVQASLYHDTERREPFVFSYDNEIITGYELEKYQNVYSEIPVIEKSMLLNSYSFDDRAYLQNTSISISRDSRVTRVKFDNFCATMIFRNIPIINTQGGGLIDRNRSQYYDIQGGLGKYTKEDYILRVDVDIRNDVFDNLPTGNGSSCSIDDLIPICDDRDRYEITIEAFTKLFYGLIEDEFITLEGITNVVPIENIKDLNNFNILDLLIGYGTTWN